MEIDKSKFGAKRKYKRGRVSEGPWVFGVVEGGSQKVPLFRVPDRTRETLVHRLITTHIRPGTVIYSGQFTSYIPLNQLGYIHLSVNHSKNFVDPDSGAHTNTIEGVWALVKKKLKSMSGTLYKYIPSYLDEFTRVFIRSRQPANSGGYFRYQRRLLLPTFAIRTLKVYFFI